MKICTGKDGWDMDGKFGLVLGDNVFIEQLWTPVLWEDADDPDWYKTAGLKFEPLQPISEELRGKITEIENG